MSKTYRRQLRHTPRLTEEKRAEQRKKDDIEEELRLLRSPLLKWEKERAKYVD